MAMPGVSVSQTSTQEHNPTPKKINLTEIRISNIPLGQGEAVLQSNLNLIATSIIKTTIATATIPSSPQSHRLGSLKKPTHRTSLRSLVSRLRSQDIQDDSSTSTHPSTPEVAFTITIRSYCLGKAHRNCATATAKTTISRKQLIEQLRYHSGCSGFNYVFDLMFTGITPLHDAGDDAKCEYVLMSSHATETT